MNPIHLKQSRRKRFFPSLLLGALLLAGIALVPSVTAQESSASAVSAPAIPAPAVPVQKSLFHAPMAPLCCEKTVAAVRINSEKLNIPELTAKVIGYILESIPDLGLPPDTAQSASIALPLMTAGYTTPVSTFLSEVESAGLGDIYIIMESDGAFIAIPVGEQSAESLQPVRTKLRSLSSIGFSIRGSFVRHGFLIAPLAKQGISDVEFREKVRARFAVLNYAPDSRFDDAFAPYPDMPAVFVFCNSAQIHEEWDKAFAELSDTVSEGADERQQTILSILSSLFRLVEMKSARVTAVLTSGRGMAVAAETDSPDEFAKQWNDGLQKISQFIASDAGADEPHQKAAELTGKLFEAFQPRTDSGRIVWLFDSAFFRQIRPILVELYKVRNEAASAEESAAAPEETLQPVPAVQPAL